MRGIDGLSDDGTTGSPLHGERTSAERAVTKVGLLIPQGYFGEFDGWTPTEALWRRG